MHPFQFRQDALGPGLPRRLQQQAAARRRADLVQAMDPTLVRDSETVNEPLGAVFHFVLVEEVRP